MRAIADLRPFLPRQLIDGAGWERLCGRVDGLPIEAPQVWGFEFRLGVADPAADLFVAAVPDMPVGRHLLAQGLAAPATSPPGALARHLQALADAGSELSQVVELTGLEYDIAEVPDAAWPAPGVFLKLRRTLRAETPPAARERALKALARAVGWRTDADVGLAVGRVLDALPPAAAVFFIGALPGRRSPAVRLIVGGIEHRQAQATLRRLRCPQAARAAASLLEALSPALPAFRIALDVAAGGVSPKIGLELFATARQDRFDSWLSTTPKDWRPVVAELVERGWCLPDKAAGLRAWCALERLYDDEGMAFLQTGINHVKLTLGGEADTARPSAKAYCGVLHARRK